MSELTYIALPCPPPGPSAAGFYEQTDGDFTVRGYAYWDYRHFPPKLVYPDFGELKAAVGLDTQ